VRRLRGESGGMPATRPLSVVAAVLGAAALLSACGGGGGGSTTSAGGAASTPTATTPARTQARAQTQARTTAGTGGVSAATLATGRQAFASNGCAGCHTLAAAGATGTVGPNLDDVLPGKSTAFIHQSIVDPNAVIASGYSANVMPQGFGQQISASDLNALVAFLHAEAGQ
jgi:cytochrome c551/c552